MRELTVITENKVGALADICEEMGKLGINISSISAHGYQDLGVVSLVTNDEISAKNALEKMGLKVMLGDLLIAKVPDKPGEMGKLTRKISKSGANIERIYLLGKCDGHLEMAIKADNLSKASASLKK
jgi:hypothetical protein